VHRVHRETSADGVADWLTKQSSLANHKQDPRFL